MDESPLAAARGLQSKAGDGYLVVPSTLAVLEARETEMTQGLRLDSESAQELPWGTMAFTAGEK